MKVIVINGVNLNFLGIRQPEIYGNETLEIINEKIKLVAEEKKIDIKFFQSNYEGEIVNYLHSMYKKADYLIINPGAFTHYSIAIRDAISSIGIKTIEVHLSNIYKREEFRRKSVISDIAEGTIAGFGSLGYLMALEYIAQKM